MAEPVEIAIAAIAAGAAVVGAATGTAATASGSSGVNVSPFNVHYPKEFPPDQFADARQSVQWDIVKFHADGGFWNNDLAVSATGYMSHDRSELVGRPQSDHPHVPINRFMVLTFDKSSNSQDMSSGLLTVNMSLWGGASDLQAEGTAEDPWVELYIHGRFDPVGPGDVEYSFKLGINTFGELRLSNENITGSDIYGKSVKLNGDHVLVTVS